MINKIFYSWQTDSPKNINRELIRDCIESALTKLSSNIEIEDSLRVDSGMENVAGTPEVASIMFQKISTSYIVIADVTLTGLSTFNAEKKFANPNVSMELGFAAGVIGWESIICVMNERFGLRSEQAFDLRNRRFPIDYKLGPEDSENIVKTTKVKTDLTNWLAEAIKGATHLENLLIDKATKGLNVNCINIMIDGGKFEYFTERDPNSFVSGGRLDTFRFNDGVSRMLNLGIIYADVRKDGSGIYAYHWTFLGKCVLQKLGLR